jgi:predicted nucleic acid-binding protein
MTITSMETKPNNQPIIADLSALISLAVVTDANHQAARDSLQGTARTGRSILIPSEVFAETVNTLGKKFGHRQAIDATTLLLDASFFVVIPATDLIRRDALTLFGTVAADVSYTDCLVMVAADTYETREIFGFDEMFEKRGYHLPSPQKEAA